MGKEELKLSLFSYNIILYAEHLKIQQKIVRTNKFSKVVGYDTKKSISFSYTNNEQSTKIKIISI